MGLYSASPKKLSAGYGSQRWSELRRRIMHRRYLCLWVLLALVPCYMLRQMFSSSSPRLSTVRPVDNSLVEQMSVEKSIDDTMETSYEKPQKAMEEEKEEKKEENGLLPRAVNVFREEEKFVEKKREIPEDKPKEKKSAKKPKKSKSKTLVNLEKFDGDFGVPEDNDKEEEQLWQAPPAPIKKPTNLEESRR